MIMYFNDHIFTFPQDTQANSLAFCTSTTHEGVPKDRKIKDSMDVAH